jgi:hypothetical protein
MKPLQARLMEAGFDGLVWQAGLGNPVAAGNFMLRRRRGGGNIWYWVDLESGVPAIFPLNPFTLFRFYLPRSFFHGRLLFDDVDVPRLRGHLETHGEQIRRELGAAANIRLQQLVDKLDSAQTAWKSSTRTGRSIAYFRRKGRLSPSDADWYQRHPMIWQLKLLGIAARCTAVWLTAYARKLVGRCLDLDPLMWARRLVRFFLSAPYRQLLAKRYVAWRIRSWKKRRFLQAADVRRLRFELRDDQSSVCVTDFGVHLAVKPAVKFLQWGVFPILFAFGLIPLWALVLLEVGGGAIGRTAYTLWRCVESTAGFRRIPWIALVVGLLPVVGNAAFPLQFIYWCRDRRRRLPEFLLLDFLASVGRAAPVWGGENSLLESWSNRLPNLLPRTKRRAEQRLQSAEALL